MTTSGTTAPSIGARTKRIRYIDEIRETCRALASDIRRGRPVDVRTDYLKYAAGVHMVYFRDCGDRLEIIRILHQMQDVNRNLLV